MVFPRPAQSIHDILEQHQFQRLNRSYSHDPKSVDTHKYGFNPSATGVIAPLSPRLGHDTFKYLPDSTSTDERYHRMVDAVDLSWL